MKFMFIPDSSDEFVPILCKYEDGKEVDNDLLKSKTLEYTGSEETVHETYIGKIYTSRFIFQCEDHKYYYEMKMSNRTICVIKIRMPASLPSSICKM